jgi:two-component system sensor kinase
MGTCEPYPESFFSSDRAENLMSGVGSNLTAKEITWLPQRYRFQRMHSQTAANFLAAVAIDTVTRSEVLIELIPKDQFNSDGLFRLEHYFGYASRLEMDAYVAPLEWGCVSETETEVEHVFMVRPHFESPTLNELLGSLDTPEGQETWNRSVPTSAKMQNRWMKTFLLAIEQLHQFGITQQDFRLSHVLTEEGMPRLLCPGLRMFSKPDRRNESFTLAFGQSASPELLGLLDHDVNDLSDVYSAGVIAYSLLNGRLPFEGSTLSQILSSHLTTQIEARHDEAFQRPLMTIVKRMLEKHPRDRYQSVSSIIADLDWLASNDDETKVSKFVAGKADAPNEIVVPMFVGRQKELDQLHELIACVREGGTRFAMVEGESGMGKTRLVRESIQKAKLLGVQIFQSEATKQVGEQPIAPLTKLINELVHSDLCPTLAEQLDDAHEEVHFFFPEFANSIGLRKPATSRHDYEKAANQGTEPLESFELNRLSRAVCSVLSKISSPHNPAIIWIDDCQWLDVSTVETLRELSRWTTDSLMVILSARTSRNQPDTSHISLNMDVTLETGPLSNSMVRELVDSMAIGLPKQVLDAVVRLAAGSPFLAETILREMNETNAISFEGSQWIVDSKRLDEVQASSDSTTETLLPRLEQFPTQILEHLSIAAVIGKSFFPSAMLSVSEISATESQSHLNWARRQRLIWARPDGSQAFVHDSIRQAMVERLPQKRKCELHKRIAEYYESIAGDSIEVAIHYDQAGLHEQAFVAALDSAKRAQEATSLATALQMYQIAWKGVDPKDSQQRSQIAEHIGNILMLSGTYGESDQWFSRAEKESTDKFDRARILMQRGELAFKKGNKRDAIALLEDAMKSLEISIPTSWLFIHLFVLRELFVQTLHSLAPSLFLHRKKSSSKLDRLKWRMYSRLAHCYWYTRGKSLTLWAHLAGLNRAEAAPPTLELAQAWSEHSPVMSLVPWHNRGAEYANRSLKIRTELNDVWGQGQSRNYFSILLYATSRYEHCIVQAEQAEEILQRTGDYCELNIARYQRAASLYRLGKLNEASELAKQTREDAIKIGAHQSTGNILDVLVRASLGNIPLEFIELEKKRGLNDLQLQPQLLCAEGVYYLVNRDDPVTAISCFEKGIEIAKKAGISNCYTTPNFAWLATALREKISIDRRNGTVSAASFHRHFVAAKQAVRIGRRFKNDLPHALRELGLAYADRADQKRARKSLMESLKLAQSQNARYESALTQQAFEQMDARFGWRIVDEEDQPGTLEVREIEASVRLSGPRETISIANRFDALLDVGRKISSALGKLDILKHTAQSACDMLHGQRTLIVLPTEGKENKWDAWNSEQPFDESIVRTAAQRKEPVIHDRENLGGSFNSKDQTASILCCPIVAGDEVVACIYIANCLVESMFGTNEVRIAEFICNAAGSSLEKETIFRELDDLNESLEQKVWDRTKSLESRTRQLEQTAQQLRATQHRLEQAAQVAESANQIKSDFLANMSHEIRTPITAVLGFTQLILRGVISDPEQQRKKIKSIESSGKHLLRLVNDLLDISKIEANKIEVENVDFSPLHLLSEIVESLRSKARENNNDLVLEFASPFPVAIQSDPKMLRQIATNILGNATKFTSDGTVTLRASLEGSKNGMLRMEIIDTGIGMTTEQVENVFDPFVQADSSITRRFGGTGLGLSISQKLTKALGGDIEVISGIGEGSTFSITVDVGDIAELELMDDEELNQRLDRRVTSDWTTADLSGLRILLADDAETNRDLISLVLGDCGAEITLAENGQEAVDYAQSDQEFDIVLMDMQMPILDGYSATRKLRDAGFETPIYALTANSMKGDRDKCMKAGCSDYLTKPIDLNGLVEAMAKISGSEISSASHENENQPEATTTHPEHKKSTVKSANSFLTFRESDLPQEDPIRKFSIKFFDTFEQRLVEFESGIQSRDKRKVAELAHWLKGTAGTITLNELSQAALEMEQVLDANDWDSVTHIYELMEQYADDAGTFRCQLV